MRPAKIFEVYEDRKKRFTQLYTKNLVPGTTVYGERLVRDGGEEFREWDPKRSKIAAGILKGCTNLGIRKGDVILYLGAASGTTISHVSDMIGKDGFAFGLDFSPRVLRELVFVAEQRKNIAPILGDASKPESYAERVCEVDVVFQDVAQSHQARIFLDNCRMFLKKGGFGIIAVKSRSVDIKKKPKQVYKEIRAELEKEMIIVDFRELDPFEKDHCMFICKLKN